MKRVRDFFMISECLVNDVVDFKFKYGVSNEMEKAISEHNQY
jgi:hypothetical protein